MPQSPLHNPHDRFFKATFSKHENAVDLLKAYLPPAIIHQLEWPTLTLLPGTFLDENLRERTCDLLFSISWNSRPALIHCLLEHQSTPERWMPLRILRYQLRIWDQWLIQNPSSDKLPLIIPIVFHHSLKPWPYSLQFSELLDAPTAETLEPEIWRAFSPSFSHLLIELRQAQADDTTDQASLRVILKFLHALLISRDGHDIHAGFEAIRALSNAGSSLDYLRTCFTYLYDTVDLDEKRFIEQIQRLNTKPELKEQLMSITQTLIEKGRREGREEGIQEGIQKGIQEGIQEGRRQEHARTVLRLLTKRFSPLPPSATERITNASEAELDAWLDALLDAPSLDKVLDSKPR